MNVEVAADGRLAIVPPRSRAGDAIVLRAEMDMAVAIVLPGVDLQRRRTTQAARLRDPGGMIRAP